MIRELDSGKTLCGCDALFEFNGMFGVLVCADSAGNEIILRAFSGSAGGRWNIDGFVPPLFDEGKYNAAIAINDAEIHRLSVAPENETPAEKSIRNQKRLALCRETLDRFYSLYRFYDLNGKCLSFADLPVQGLVPTGTGDCCAPKLLSRCFELGLRPLSMAEFYWGKENTRLRSRFFYPPCDEKCSIILPAILGMEIIYRDDDIIVINKKSGLLSVPGRGEDKQDCAVSRIRKLFPDCIEQPSVHRLDMDTSGLMVMAFNAESQRDLSIQFQKGNVQKKYIAVLDGIPENKELHISRATRCGRLELKFRLDVDNRPHQIYDEVYGKTGITLWERLRIWNLNGKTVTSVRFTPLTGRTHQLRLASASVHGLNAPIVGDNLYGVQNPGERLLLHAFFLSFTHPVTGQQMEFHREPDFRY